MVKARRVLGLNLGLIFFCFSQSYLIFASDFLNNEDDPAGKREALLRQLSDLESPGNANDLAIIESLIDLSNSSAALQLYGEASEFLSRALQIQRRSSGLFSPNQVPIIFAKMEIDSHFDDWESVNPSLENLYWLVMNKNLGSGDELIEHLARLTEFHLRGVLGDKEELQAYHYQQASKIAYQSLEIGKRLWEPHDKRLLQLYYSLIKQLYMQSAAVEQGDDTAYALRAVVPGSTWVRPRRVVQAGFYQAGLTLYEDMSSVILKDEEGSLETLAMLNLYIADWHLLFDQRVAEETYLESISMFQDVSLDQVALDTLLDRPRLLPIPKFFETVRDAIEEDLRLSAIKNAQLSSGSNHKIFFQNWSDQMRLHPLVVSSDSKFPLNQNKSDQFHFRFRLNALDVVAHWVKGRYRTNISVADELQMLEGRADTNLEFIDDQLRLLHFRPRFEDGSAKLSQGILVYDALN